MIKTPCRQSIKNTMLIFAVIMLSFGCSESPTDDGDDNGNGNGNGNGGVEPVLFTSTISGMVTLENQEEHSNALIYLDSLDRGVSSDSSGGYTIQFSDSDSDSVQTGMFTIYYFLLDYGLDSAFIWLEDGLVKLDTMDVDSNGNLPLKELSQLIRVQLWTEREEYLVGDTIVITGRFTNLSDDTLNIRFGTFWSEIGGLFLYRNLLTPSFSFFSLDAIRSDRRILLPPGEIFEGEAGKNGNLFIPEISVWTWEPIIFTEYVLIEDHLLRDRDRSLPNGIMDYIVHNWRGNLNRGPAPRHDYRPNKFELPR